MTKEELENRFIKLFDLTEGFTVKHFKWIIDEFFSQNVVIPRGENRHIYADIFHEWAEDTTKQVQYLEGIWLNTDYLNTSYELRIKPSKPVWEYMYYDQAGNTKWCTKDNAPINMWCAEEARRVHQ